ncbi:MAG TPA: hypothetical protein VGH34_10370 [Vicinamibacterales bacterium]
MAKFESSIGGLAPALVLAAGVFSATLLRQGGSGEAVKPAAPAVVKTTPLQTPDGSGSVLADLKPVMELLGESLGVSLDQGPTQRALRTLSLDSAAGASQVRSAGDAKALSDLEALLAADRTPEAASDYAWCQPESTTGMTAAKSATLLQALLQAGIKPDAPFQKLRTQVADSFLDDLGNHQALCRLVTATRSATNPVLDVQFLLATIPDYVDSNSGWVADETLGAIQSAMSHAGFVLDRFKLIDWSRADNARTDGVASDSRLHERQPGALIFRKIDEPAKKMTFQVVLLVLETPTTGVHRKALANAIDFIYRWAATMDPQPRRVRVPDPSDPAACDSLAVLRVVAPTFSGSVPSLALELKHWRGPTCSVSLVAGSAMADANPTIVSAIAPGVKYESAAQPTSAEMMALSRALGRMNPAWSTGEHVALLVESNTSFGQSAAPANAAGPVAAGPRCRSFPGTAISPAAFPCATVYRFPLHVSQLRSDATLSQPGSVSLLPTPIVPLSFRDTTPASDQLPALRPQLASPVAEATVDNILDNIRHEDLDVVGIVATDARDALFLAREVRKAAPDAQLFFVGSYLLYLQPEYLPYTRGALVASPYPLALGAQRTNGGGTDRDAFPSFIAAGVFNATSIQLRATSQLVDYCDPAVNFSGAKPGPCKPPVWVTVIGNDGYWPLTYETSNADFVHEVKDATPPTHHQTPLTTASGLTAIVLALWVGSVVWASVYLFLELLQPSQKRWRLPFLRAIAQPATYHGAIRLHAFAVFLCTLLLASLSSWLAKVLTIQLIGQRSGPPVLVTLVAWTVLLVVLSPGVAVVCQAYTRGSAKPALNALPQAPLPSWNRAMIGVCSALMFGTLWYFGRFLEATTYPVPSDPAAPAAAFDANRFLAGGIISPLPATTLLFGGLLVGMIAGVRRLSLVGRGYTALADGSPAFRLFTGAPREFPGSSFRTCADHQQQRGHDLRYFAALLDMPVQNLPKPYLVGVCTLVVAVVWILRGWVPTIDGAAFSQFMTLATLSILVATMLLAGQAASTWNSLKPKLARLAHARIAESLGRVGHVVRWDLSIAPPHLSELMALAARADTLRDGMIAIGNRGLGLKVKQDFPNRRTLQSVDVLASWCASSLAVRPQDLTGLTRALCEHNNSVGRLRDEIVIEKSAPLLQSEAWFGLWSISDNLVTLLEQTHWQRCPAISSDGAADRHGEGIVREKDASAIATWFRQCEEFVAVQYAFVVRDILARMMSPLFAAMLCLAFLSGAHLFYLFPGRSSLLTIDLLAMVSIAVVAIPIVVGMERDTVLSLLRRGTPDRIDFSWDFAKRVALYGVLPLLAVIGSLFPEIGGSFFGWLEPLRKLVAF